MDLKSLFGGVAIGKDTSGNFKLTFGFDHSGLAVRTQNGQFFIRDGSTLRDVTDITVDIADGFVFKLPVTQVAAGDIILVSENPFSAVFVQEVRLDGQIRVLDPNTSAAIDHVQPTNLLNQRFFIKAVSLLDNLGGGSGAGNNLLLLFLLSRSGTGGGTDDLLPFLLLLQQPGGGQPIDKNLLLLLLLRSDSNKSDALELLLLLQTLGGIPGGGSPPPPSA